MKFPLAFTDGASHGNPGSAGWGVVAASDTEVIELGGHIENGTNNQAELKAAVRALRWATDRDADSLHVYTDSGYLRQGATQWSSTWRQNGWETQSGDPVQNKTLWKQLLELQSKLDVTYVQISGHAGIPANERADDIATAYAGGDAAELYAGPRSDYEIALAADPQRFPDGPRYISLVDDEVQEHHDWSECEDRVNGKDAQFRKVETVSQRDQVLAEWGKSPEDITD